MQNNEYIALSSWFGYFAGAFIVSPSLTKTEPIEMVVKPVALYRAAVANLGITARWRAIINAGASVQAPFSAEPHSIPFTVLRRTGTTLCTADGFAKTTQIISTCAFAREIAGGAGTCAPILVASIERASTYALTFAALVFARGADAEIALEVVHALTTVCVASSRFAVTYTFARAILVCTTWETAPGAAVGVIKSITAIPVALSVRCAAIGVLAKCEMSSSASGDRWKVKGSYRTCKEGNIEAHTVAHVDRKLQEVKNSQSMFVGQGTN